MLLTGLLSISTFDPHHKPQRGGAPPLELLWVAVCALSQICGIVQILLDTFSELRFSICLVINVCVCFVSWDISLRAGAQFYRDNGFVFSATKETQR